MRTKKVSRYWCDHCNKGGLSAPAMAKHEEHCTLNPARNCRVCTLINGGHHVGAGRMAELVALLPDPTEYLAAITFDNCVCKACSPHLWASSDVPCTNKHAKLSRAIEAAMPKLREETDGCPACIMAALRQRRIPVGMVESFSFTGEMKTVFADMEPRQGHDY